MSNSNSNFRKLTPTVDADISVYSEALDYVFTQKDLRNIGLTGSYGSGKSSIIRTYDLRNRSKSFLYVSLAHFDDDIESQDSGDVKTVNNLKNDVTVLEGKIINQLIHQLDDIHIPKTRFKIKRQSSSNSILLLTLGLILFLLSLAYTIFFNSWTAIINAVESPILKSLLTFTTEKTVLVLNIAFLTGLLGIGFYVFFTLQKDRQVIRKLSFSGNEIEVFSDSDESYFDKYLNEVLYIFEGVKANAIVFEDIDRYNCVKIFQRLREINELVNNRLPTANPLRFFYLIRDDIFNSKDRTKFFDFIIPIMPIVDSSNSFDQLYTYFEKCGFLSKFQEGFLRKISVFIDDMRILNNICNEFMIYAACIDKINPDFNRILSLIIYKNLFPKDFCKLQLNDGYFNHLLEKKDAHISMLIAAKQVQKKENAEKINLLNSEMLNSKRELDLLFYALKSGINGSNLSENSDAEYLARIQLIEQRNNGEVSKLELKNRELDIEIQKIMLMSIAEVSAIDNDIFSPDNSLKNQHYLDVINSPYFNVLKYLIRNDYINANYHSFITYFYPGKMGVSDKAFLMSTLNLSAPIYEYSLNSPDLIAVSLDLIDFRRTSVLNFDLLSYLYKTKSTNKQKLTTFIDTMIRTDNVEFVIQYFDIAPIECLADFSIDIASYWPTLICRIIDLTDKVSNSTRNNIVLQFLKLSKGALLVNLNHEGKFAAYVDRELINFDIKINDIDQIMNSLIILNIKLSKIDYNALGKALWQQIYSMNLYELNAHNIVEVLHCELGVLSYSNFSCRCITNIFHHQESNLAKYAKKELPKILALILKTCNGLITDSPDVIPLILNSNEISSEDKFLYISYMQYRLPRLESVESTTLWPALLSSEKVGMSAFNIITYFYKSGNGLDQTLIDSINHSEIPYSLRYDENNKFNPAAFIEEIINCNLVSDAKCLDFIRVLNSSLKGFDYKNISNSRLSHFIMRNYLTFDKILLDYIRDSHPENLLLLIQSNILEYISLAKNEGVRLNELVIILAARKIRNIDKVSLLKLTEEPIATYNNNFPDLISAYIIAHNLNTNELPALLTSFSSLGSKTRAAIADVLPQYKPLIIDKNIAVPYFFLKQLLSDDTINNDKKLNLYLHSISLISYDENIRCLVSLKYLMLAKVFKARNSTVDLTIINKKIVSAMVSRGWITAFTISDDQTLQISGYNTVES